MAIRQTFENYVKLNVRHFFHAELRPNNQKIIWNFCFCQ